MRLINVESLKFEEFNHDIPPYAILSHTWGNEEVTFQEYQEYVHGTNRCLCPGTNTGNSNIEKKAGFAKIMGACGRAHADGLGYLWCDTNCIDKSSSAELTEAINSMYAWYRDSVVCYAYLADVATFDTTSRGAEEFRKSRWFTRGWTLQELLAPKEVLFFNKGWGPIAARRHLAEIIRGITRIHSGALLDRNTIHQYSVAQRMSWAANRQTSKQEDIAYCLLGIFAINMPLLYGEGIKAFIRLQEEIIKVSDDQSILAWDFLGRQQQPLTGMLAASPSAFARCGSIVRDTTVIPRPYSVTNLGIALQLPMIQTFVKETALVGLNCSVELREYRQLRDGSATMLPSWRFPVWIWLRSIDHNIYIRNPNPVSRTSLAIFYPEETKCVDTKLFGVVSTSRAESWVSDIISSTHGNSALPTGFHVTISFGRFKPQTDTFEEAFPPGGYTIHQIPPRGSPALSHELISAGNYAVLLSILWDYQRQPKLWRHAVLLNSNNTILHTMSTNDWSILFASYQQSNNWRPDDVDRIAYVHDRVRQLTNQSVMTAQGTAEPFVRMEKDLWQDHHGQVKVVVDVIFQEPTRPRRLS